MPILAVHTTEGVVLELDVADAGSRFVAALVDTLLLAVQIGLGAFLLVQLAQFDPSGASDVLLAMLVGGAMLLVLAAQTFAHVRGAGSSLGKRLVGLAVISEEGHVPSTFQLLVRSLLWLVEWIPVPVPIGLVVIFFHPRRQRLGDLVAGTLVVRKPGVEPEPWSRTRWSEMESRLLPLTLGSVAPLGGEDLAFLRRVIGRQGMEERLRERLLADVARHYCERLGIPMAAEPRTALREIYLCLREARGATSGAGPARPTKRARGSKDASAH